MGITKSESFTKEQNETAQLLKALAHPARVAIIEHLLKAKSCICGDIVNELPLAQATISQHLKELKSVGIIKGSIAGNTICYCLHEPAFERLTLYFQAIRTGIKGQQLGCC